MWATPALHRDLVIVPTDGGRLLGIDRRTGGIRWTKRLPGPVWQSPVVVDDVLLQADCYGILHAYDVSDASVDPPELWTLPLGGCVGPAQRDLDPALGAAAARPAALHRLVRQRA